LRQPYYADNMATLYQGDSLEVLREMGSESVQCCVTSPPYWGLRDYGADGQIGLETTPEGYITSMVEVFREVRRVLRNDGTLWLNIGDSYATGAGSCRSVGGGNRKHESVIESGGYPSCQPNRMPQTGLKPKDLVGIPWMLAFALRADGWYLRSDIIWSKPNPMPESVADRPTKAHEYVFLLSKSERYYYDAEAIKEPCKDSSVERLGQNVESQAGSSRGFGGMKANGPMKAVCGDKRGHASGEDVPYAHNSQSRHGNAIKPPLFGGAKAEGYGTRKHSGKEWNPTQGGGGTGFDGHSGNRHADGTPYLMANKRTVWNVPTKSCRFAHFATYPPDLIKPCILAGCPEGGMILDPFAGSGTTLEVARDLGRKSIGIELSPEYCDIAIKHRLKGQNGLGL